MTASKAPSQPERVLIIKPSALGDVVTAMPVLRGLKRTFPECSVSWLVNVNCEDLISHDSDLDEIVAFDRRKMGKAWRSLSAAGLVVSFLWKLRRSHFDWVLDLQGLLRSGIFTRATGASVRAGFASAREGAAWFYNHRFSPEASHTVDRNIELAQHLGVDARSEDMTLQIAPEAQQFADEFMSDNNLQAGGFIACVPPTRWETKLYPSRHWRRVVSALAKRTTVVLLGGPGDRDLCQAAMQGTESGAINLAGQTGVREFVAMIGASGGVICGDSAASFIAPAVGVDSIALIGPTRTERTGPYGGGRAIVGDTPCQGCLKKQCSHITCMQIINPDEVIEAAGVMLASVSNRPTSNIIQR
ncbi:MAG: glycosyltransferase family 9 protein [Phycisphaerae bacterium]|jgi:lipopolysaccharide heptosyltransferase I|nr:glycosyltransferase family 9 protein [Phycisphaerae bacterium]